MTRYARELASALSGIEESRWQLQLIRPAYSGWLARFWKHPQADRIDSSVARYLRHPWSLQGSTADLFHVPITATVISCDGSLRAHHRHVPRLDPAVEQRDDRFRLMCRGMSHARSDFEFERCQERHV